MHIDVILSPSRWRKPIRAGGVKFSQASSAAVRDLVAVGDYRRSLRFTVYQNVKKLEIETTSDRYGSEV